MTEQLRQVLDQVESLPPHAQDAIAKLIRDELERREQRKRQALEALDRLEAFWEDLRRADRPPVDAVRIVREGREELERRSAL